MQTPKEYSKTIVDKYLNLDFDITTYEAVLIAKIDIKHTLSEFEGLFKLKKNYKFLKEYIDFHKEALKYLDSF